MKYFIIAGEASGDIHGASLIDALKKEDAEAQFQFLGGDMMAASAGVQPLIHYRDMAYMGFIEVMKHLPTILGFMKTAKQAIMANRPDAVILIDYPSFNLKIAKFAHAQGIPCFYFISPKVWVWKEYRVKDIKRYIARLFSILPFETAFFRKHNYEVEYVGNPTVKEIAEASEKFTHFSTFAAENSLDEDKPVIALVPGSRRKEIRDNLPTMVEAALRHTDCQLVIAGAPSIDQSLYDEVLEPLGTSVPVLYGKSFELVHHARVALVTSGTATLETAILGTPQVACYRMNGSKLLFKFYRRLLKGKYVTLPNLVTDEPVIPELLLHFCSVEAVDSHLTAVLTDSPEREQMLQGYRRMAEILTEKDCTACTAQGIVEYLNKK
ncbi:MAG: lipid-A-disaccharide synthase [Muribaculaceae bacterium]|nr:lipid-A-disaccharide synthase [Muribaculaceae bacterium]